MSPSTRAANSPPPWLCTRLPRGIGPLRKLNSSKWSYGAAGNPSSALAVSAVWAKVRNASGSWRSPCPKNLHCQTRRFGGLLQPSVSRIYWLSPGRSFRLGLDPLPSPGNIDETVRCWKQALETHERFQIELRLRSREGHYRWHLCRAQPMRDPDGKVLLWVGSHTDIRDQKLAEEKLERIVAERTASSTKPSTTSKPSRTVSPTICARLCVP